MDSASTFRVVDRGRAPRNPLVRLKALMFAGTQLFVSRGHWWRYGSHLRRDACFRPTDPASLWLVVRASPASTLGASMCSASSPRRPVFGRTPYHLLGLRCKLCSQHRCSPHLLGHIVQYLLVPLRIPHVSSPNSSGSIRFWARASSFTTCAHAFVPIVRTSTPCTALAWMNTTSPVGARPQPWPMSQVATARANIDS